MLAGTVGPPGRGKRKLPTDTATLLALVLLAVVASDRVTQLRSRGGRAVDFYQFWLVGQSIKSAPPGNVYSPQVREQLESSARQAAALTARGSALEQVAKKRAVLVLSAPPLLFAAASLLPADYEQAFVLFCYLSTLALVAAVCALCAAHGLGVASTLLVLALVLGVAQPASVDLLIGNIGQVELAGLTAALLLLGRDSTIGQAAAGAVLAALVALKPNVAAAPALLALGLLADRKRVAALRFVAGAAIGGFVSLVIGAVRFGRLGIWTDWLFSMRDLDLEPLSLAMGNFSTARIAREALGLQVPSALLAVPVFLLAGLAVLLSRSRGQAAWPTLGRATQLVGLAIAATLLSSPLSWIHYFLLLLPAQVWLVRPSSRPLVRAIAALTFLLQATNPLANFAGTRSIPWMAIEVASSAVLLFIACALDRPVDAPAVA